jgi:epoxyqueuosine reductase QueG
MSCGISKSGFLNDEAERFEKWLKNNYHGTMSYMERNFDKRLDTTKLVEGSKSVISLYLIIIQKRNKIQILIKFQNMHMVLIIIML